MQNTFNISENFIQYLVKCDDTLSNLIGDCINDLSKYIKKCYYKSKNERLHKWNCTNPDLYNLTISTFTFALLHKNTTYQAFIGMLHNKIKINNLRDKLLISAEIVAILHNSGLVKIKRHGSGKSILVNSAFALNQEIPVEDKHYLQVYRPQTVTKNFDEVQGSMLLGSKLNHHDADICLDHINRMNKIPLCLSKRFLINNEEQPTFELNTPEKQKQWNKHKQDPRPKNL